MDQAPSPVCELFARHGLDDPAWRAALGARLADAGAQRRIAGLLAFLDERRERLLPPAPQVFAALTLTPLAGVRVIILGQDPYPTPGDAHGLAFSVQRGAGQQDALPRSLRNVFAELARERGPAPSRGDLSHWARQGVLLLNAILTLERQDHPGALPDHRGRGWEQVTAAILDAALAQEGPRAVLLWGRGAIAAYGQRPDAAGRLVLRASHPSPLSVRRPCGDAPAFAGCGHFARVDRHLRDAGLPAIDWRG